MDENKLDSVLGSDALSDVGIEAVNAEIPNSSATANSDCRDAGEPVGSFSGSDGGEPSTEESPSLEAESRTCNAAVAVADLGIDGVDFNSRGVTSPTSEVEEVIPPKATRKHGKKDASVEGEPKRRRDGLGYAITGTVLLIICGVMLAFLISSFCSAAELIAALSPDRGFIGISVIVAIMVTIISAVGCIMASLALLYISSLALSRSEGVFKYVAVAQMSISVLFILASIILSVVVITMV